MLNLGLKTPKITLGVQILEALRTDKSSKKTKIYHLSINGFRQTWVERREWWEDRAEGDPLPEKCHFHFLILQQGKAKSYLQLFHFHFLSCK